MAEKKSTKNNKNMIIGCCVAAVAVIAIIIAVIVINANKGLSDAYFVSDGSKYVLTMDADEMDLDGEEEFAPVKTHIVYTYSGDEITGMKAYYEFADEATAKKAFDYYNDADSSEEFKEVALDGKYVILTANESDYENLTASDVKQQIEFMEMLKNVDLEDTDDTSDTDDSDIVEEDVVDVDSEE